MGSILHYSDIQSPPFDIQPFGKGHATSAEAFVFWISSEFPSNWRFVIFDVHHLRKKNWEVRIPIF